MNQKQIEYRLAQLAREKYLSDEELEESIRLTEELELVKNDSAPRVKPLKKERRTLAAVLISAISKKMEKKPVTMEELEQLKMESIKYKLKADIAESKARMNKNKGDGLTKTLSIFGGGTEKDYSALLGNPNKKINI